MPASAPCRTRTQPSATAHRSIVDRRSRISAADCPVQPGAAAGALGSCRQFQATLVRLLGFPGGDPKPCRPSRNRQLPVDLPWDPPRESITSRRFLGCGNSQRAVVPGGSTREAQRICPGSSISTPEFRSVPHRIRRLATHLLCRTPTVRPHRISRPTKPPGAGRPSSNYRDVCARQKCVDAAVPHRLEIFQPHNMDAQQWATSPIIADALIAPRPSLILARVGNDLESAGRN